jgi:hypothetical protein
MRVALLPPFIDFLLSSTVIMAPQSNQQNTPFHNAQRSLHPLSASPSPATQTEHADTAKRPEKPSTTLIPSAAGHTSGASHSAPMRVYLCSDEPVDRRLMPGFACRPQHQLLVPQAKPEHEGATDEGTRALEEWMAEVTAHPERAMWSRDIERVLPSTTELYEMLPSDEGVPSSVSRLRSIAPPDSIQPMLFCSCCTPDTPAPRS